MLGALQYLSRGWTFDDLNKSAAIHEETHRQFFNVFIEWGATYLCSKHVFYPTNFLEVKTHMHEHNLAGLPGCLRSMDAIHISVEKCWTLLRNHHKGRKNNIESQAFYFI